MHNQTAIVITTINKLSKNIINISNNCKKKKWLLFIIGDKKSSKNFKLPFGFYYSLRDQKKINLYLPNKIPINSYSRKNVGYLLAIKKGAKKIIETDDDNYPYKSFYNDREEKQKVKIPKINGFFNVYKYSTQKKLSSIWQRGFPIEDIENNKNIKFYNRTINSLVQQGLCDGNPDVDAIFGLINKKIYYKFEKKKKVWNNKKYFFTYK